MNVRGIIDKDCPNCVITSSRALPNMWRKYMKGKAGRGGRVTWCNGKVRGGGVGMLAARHVCGLMTQGLGSRQPRCSLLCAKRGSFWLMRPFRKNRFSYLSFCPNPGLIVMNDLPLGIEKEDCMCSVCLDIYMWWWRKGFFDVENVRFGKTHFDLWIKTFQFFLRHSNSHFAFTQLCKV